MHDLLMLRCHGTKGVEKVSRPHDLRVHDDLVYQMVGMGDELALLGGQNTIDLTLNLLGTEILILLVFESVGHLFSASSQLSIRVKFLKQNLKLVLNR